MMLIVAKNTNSTLIVTLTEKVTLASPYYLFAFTSDVSQLTKYFISADISIHTDRYNEFLITETSGTEILTSGTITLNPTGQWTYRIYEQTSSTNLDPNLTTSLLEIGIVKVTGTATTYYTNSGLDNTFYINE